MFTTNEIEQSKNALMNVSYYDSIADYMTGKYSDVNTIEESEQAFKDSMENGYIQQITLGTYNGALNTTQYMTIDNVHILHAILTEINETEFMHIFDDDKTNYSMMDWITDYTFMHDVFIIEKHIYVNID